MYVYNLIKASLGLNQIIIIIIIIIIIMSEVEKNSN